MKRLALFSMFALILTIGCGQEAAKEPVTEPSPEVSDGAVQEPAETSSGGAESLTPAAPQPGVNGETAPPEAAEATPTGLAAELAHHNFILKTFDGAVFTRLNPDGTPAPQPNLSFGQWPHVNGKICNSYNAQGQVDGLTLKFEKAASTMMLCFDENLNRLEGAFHQTMNEGAEVTLADKTLILKGSQHTFEFELSDYVN